MAKAKLRKYIINRWYDVYKEVAGELVEFYEKNGRLSGNVLYRLCKKNEKFVGTNKWIEKFKPAFGVESLDPIHILPSLMQVVKVMKIELRRLT